MKKILQIVLPLVIIGLTYLVYESIMKPVRFNKISDQRKNVVINKLKDIRTAQVSYKAVNNVYCNNFDTLIDFLKTGEFQIMLKIGNVPDSLSEEKALEMGIIVREESFVKVADSLFKNKGLHYADSLPFIPYSEGERFTIDAKEIERSMIQVQVFEVATKYKYFLKGLDTKLYDENLLLKVGSLEEVSIDGNWE